MMDEIVSCSQYGGGGRPVPAFSPKSPRQVTAHRSFRAEESPRHRMGGASRTVNDRQSVRKSSSESAAHFHRSPVGPELLDVGEGHQIYPSSEYAQSSRKETYYEPLRPPLSSSLCSPRRSSVDRSSSFAHYRGERLAPKRTRSTDALPIPALQQVNESKDHRQSRSLRQSPPEPQTLIEISPGHLAPLRSAKDTHVYIQKNQVVEGSCFACSATLFCVQDASYVLCPTCKVVSPLLAETCMDQDGSVGMGFSFETFIEILSRTEHVGGDNAFRTQSPNHAGSEDSAPRTIERKEEKVVTADPKPNLEQNSMAKNGFVSLNDIFPSHIAKALSEGQKVEAERHDEVTIFFSDIVSFTSISAKLDPRKVADMLDRFYLKLDKLSSKYEVWKVETIGDSWMGAANLFNNQGNDHAKRIAQFAVEAVRAANETWIDLDDKSLGVIDIRVGLHSGPVVSDVVGQRNPRYCLFGDTVNTASRIETTSKKNAIQCSDTSAEILKIQWPDLELYSRGKIPLKGKGEMNTFWVNENPEQHERESPPAGPVAFEESAINSTLIYM